MIKNLVVKKIYNCGNAVIKMFEEENKKIVIAIVLLKKGDIKFFLHQLTNFLNNIKIDPLDRVKLSLIFPPFFLLHFS